MSTKEVRSNEAAGSTSVANLDMKLEVVVIPVSDVDRAKEFYSRLGWRLDADRSAGDNFRLVQFTPPGSGSSIQFGVNLTSAAPGSAQAMLLAVSDIEAARQQLVAQGVDASEVFHCAEGTACRFQGVGVRISGPQPNHLSYSSFVSFTDPDGNGWLLQEVTKRLAGRIDSATTTFASANDLASAFRRAAAAHGEHEKRRAGRPELARLVRRVHGARAVWRRTAAINDEDRPFRAACALFAALRPSQTSVTPKRRFYGVIERIIAKSLIESLRSLPHLGGRIY